MVRNVFLGKKTGSYNDITEQLYVKNIELAHTNKTLALLRKIDVHVLDSKSTTRSLASVVCDELMATNNYKFLCMITRSDVSETDYYVDDVRSSDSTRQAKLQSVYKNAALNNSSLYSMYNTTEIDVAADSSLLYDFFKLNGSSARFVKDLKALGVGYVAIHTLHSNTATHGLLLAGYTSQEEVTPAEKEFLSRIIEACGVALDNKFLYISLQKTAHMLKVSNNKLKALDETKDDFISMASHQLRTPLTSVKGYLSMVLDGDAGTVTPLQKKMLNQAFMSSQRMVFLIADLLNVSRLKTGKFVIDRGPLDLSHLIHEELGQLHEMAASRAVKLEYDHPKDFPALLLDETKTRQVVMNFIDNAIHYTPAGGHITVELADKAHIIELRVRDNGIGVPKSEQHHLFTKFYRAANARRERPDGTGLGLFMAKKVIIAQGGAVLFDSKEGKGSTFGFTLPKDKLLVRS